MRLRKAHFWTGMAVRREVKEVLGRLGLTDAVDEDSGMDLKPGDIEPISSSRIIRLLECARGAWAAGLKQTNPRGKVCAC